MNVRIFWVRVMKCMCAQARPWFILSVSSKRVFWGNGVWPMLTPREISPLPENVPRGGSNPQRCGQRAQTLPTSYSGPTELVLAVVCCVTPLQNTTASLGQICSDNCTHCRTKKEAADLSFLLHPFTVLTQANQSQHWLCNVGRLAGQPLKYPFWSHWYDSIGNPPPPPLGVKPDLVLGSAVPRRSLSTRPQRRFWVGHLVLWHMGSTLFNAGNSQSPNTLATPLFAQDTKFWKSWKVLSPGWPKPSPPPPPLPSAQYV